MAEIVVTADGSGGAYVALVVGDAPAVRDSVSLEELEAGSRIPALDAITLDFDHYGRLVGVRVDGSAESVLAPSLLDAAAPPAPAMLEDPPRS
jgi:hypothetical protein